MADNTDEEHLDNPTKNQSENPPDEISPINDTETINSIQETEEMEVHHHAHDPAIPHHKKNWKSYFWEFLMLFLAVFCGFLAEYQLEHVIERDREKQYMKSLVRDLKKDTAFLNSAISKKLSRIKIIDSVFLFFENKPLPNEIPGYVILQMKNTTFDQMIERNNSTIEQMKNSGNLRLIRKQNIGNSLAEYDLLWERAGLWREMYLKRQDENISFQHKIINGLAYLQFYRQDIGSYYRDAPSVKIHPEHLEEYFNLLLRQKGTTRNDVAINKKVYDSAIKLIDLINKEYHLE